MAEPNLNLKNCNLNYVFDYQGLKFTNYSGNKGEGLPKHEHGEHFVMVACGKVCIRKENIYKELSAGDPPLILRGGEWHEIEILEDNTVFINSGG
jgi:quercetin dioxygenase-like cupin family protein